MSEMLPEGHDKYVYGPWDLTVLPDRDLDVTLYVQFRYSPIHVDHDDNAELRMTGTYEIMTGSGSRNAEKFLSAVQNALREAGFYAEISVKPRWGLANLVEAPDVDES